MIPATRRTIFGAIPAAIGLLAVTKVQASPVIQPSLRPSGPWLVEPHDAEWRRNHEWQMFTMAMRTMHPGGQAAAEHAKAAGVELSDLFLIGLDSWGAPDDPTMAPMLMFSRKGEKSRTFRPRGEDQ